MRENNVLYSSFRETPQRRTVLLRGCSFTAYGFYLRFGCLKIPTLFIGIYNLHFEFKILSKVF